MNGKLWPMSMAICQGAKDFLEADLFLEPVLVTASVPTGQIVRVERVAIVGEGLDNVAIGSAIAKHNIDLFAERLWQAGNLAGPPVGMGRARW